MRRTSYSDELKMEVIVGAFIVMVLLGLGYFTIILSRETWFGPKYFIDVKFSTIMGLRDGDNVVIRGMPVGKVKELKLADNGVHVIAKLDRKLKIHEGYKMSIVSTSVLGGRYLEITDGPLDRPELPEGTGFQGTQPIDLMADAAIVISEIKQGLTTGGVVSNVQSIAQQLNEIATRVNAGKGTLGKLLSEDDTLYKDLAATVASLKNVSERLDKGEGTLGKLLSKDDKLYQDLSAAVEAMKNIAQRIDNGEGTVGKLVKDDELYTEIKKTIGEVRATVDDYRETAPVTTFTSIFFGAL